MRLCSTDSLIMLVLLATACSIVPAPQESELRARHQPVPTAPSAEAILPSGRSYPTPRETASGPWAYLGPSGPYTIIGLAVSPAWPRDGTMVGLRSTNPGTGERIDSVRTTDGGRSWTRVPVPASAGVRGTSFQRDVFDFAPVAAGAASAQILFLSGPSALLRSDDAGARWQVVLRLSPRERVGSWPWHPTSLCRALEC
jgi:hypothetical protein